MKVWRGHPASRVHFRPDCPGRATRVTKHPLQELDLADLKAVQFCRTCTPREVWQRPQTLHTVCKVCNWSRPMPCPHNGGVAVLNADEATWFSKTRRRVNRRWRWPENVMGGTLANSPDRA